MAKRLPRKRRPKKRGRKKRNKPATLRPGSVRWFKRLAELQLPVPLSLQLKGPPPKSTLRHNTPSDPRFQKLQKQWYAKLAKEGFKDIEWVDHTTGYGQDSGYLKQNRVDKHRYEAMQEFYRMAGVYANHAEFALKWDRDIWTLFSEGFMYRQILKQLRAKRMRRSLFYIWARIDFHMMLLRGWHDEHPEGLYAKYEEPYVADILLKEP